EIRATTRHARRRAQKRTKSRRAVRGPENYLCAAIKSTDEGNDAHEAQTCNDHGCVRLRLLDGEIGVSSTLSDPSRETDRTVAGGIWPRRSTSTDRAGTFAALGPAGRCGKPPRRRRPHRDPGRTW